MLVFNKKHAIRLAGLVFMQRTIATVLLAASIGTTTSFADGLLFDFGSDATPTIGGESGPAEVWNNVTSIGQEDFGFLGPLLTAEGNSTFIALQMVSRFNGPNESGTTSAGIYPATATRDSLYGNTELWQGLENITPIFKLYGLDPAATYTFTFYASRTGVGDNRETRYTVTGASETFVDLDAANNVTNTVTVSDVVPDGMAEITIALTPGPNNNNGNHFTYLNVLEVEGSTVERMLLDFGAEGSRTEVVEAPPSAFWNNIGTEIGTSDTGLLGGVVTTNGTVTAIALQMQSRFNTFNGNGATTATEFPVTASQDSLFGNTESFNQLSNIEPAFKLTGLDPAFAYTFTFYGSRMGVSDNRETQYTVTGENSGEGLLNTANNIDETVTVADIRPTALGEITVEITAGPNNNNANHFAYLGVMQVDFAPVQSPRILIDFGGANTMELGTDDPYDAWNNVTLAVGTTDDGVLSNLLRTDGSATAISLEMVSRFNGNNENGTQVGIEGGAPYEVDATRDTLYGNTELFNGLENVFPAFNLTGLNPSTAYDLTFYASRMGVGDNREARFTVTGASETFADLNAANNEFETVTVNDVLPDTTGKITIRLAPGPNNDNGSHFTYLGVLQLDWEGVDAGPAPAISDATFENGTFRFTLNGTAGVTYTVQRTTDFSAWEDVETVTLTGDSEAVELTATESAAFYQVVAE